MQLINRCPFCKTEEETGQHLFLECQVTQQLWEPFMSICDGDFVWNTDWASITGAVGHKDLSELGKFYWKLIIHAICWGIWLERNARVFDGEERSIQQVIGSIKKLIWAWGLQDSIGRSVRSENVMFDWHSILY
ncbi:hypothetical protein ACHQM5_008688 [Ranunculus cassubicifolius]